MTRISPGRESKRVHGRVGDARYTGRAPRSPGIVAIAGSDGRNLHLLATDVVGGLVAAGSTGVNISAAGTTVVKGSPGILRRVVVASGVANATVKLFNVGSSGCTGTPT